jgi:hypothetical protein
MVIAPHAIWKVFTLCAGRFWLIVGRPGALC